MDIIIIGVVAAIALIAVYAAEIHANNKRIENGEPPIRHHDITDWPDPVYTIDVTPRKRR